MTRIALDTSPHLLPSALLWLAACAAALQPALALWVRGSANALMFLLVLLAIAATAWRGRLPPASRFGATVRQWWLLCAALALPFVAACLSTLAAGMRTPQVLQQLSVLDTPLRLALFAPVLWLLLQVPARWLRQFQWGCVAGALAAALILHRQIGLSEDGRPTQILFSNLLPFTNIALLLGLLSLLSIGWSRRAALAGKLAIALKLLGAAAGFYVSYASGARGSWVALMAVVPVLVCLAPVRLGAKVLAAVLLAGALAAVYYSSERVQQRIDEVRTEIVDYQAGRGLDSSVGNRLQLWGAAWRAFESHPLLGVSRQGYAAAMKEAAQAGVITQEASGFRHSHNEFMYNLATLGALGGLGMLAVYLAPAWVFLRAARRGTRAQRVAAAMGLVLAVGFLASGLTEVMFAMSLVAAFYGVMTALLVALAVRPEQPRSPA
ncbi:O-Antigen ligase [Pigmentiphaga humi]|uniref:O-Antigen ligase n=1 Tax=Pigmentiphaga humi TaxID=2478468 RepID=A0A3P4B4F0_9BURK|nr:O-antigen ligase family protein [Pigmentiphaga humi]VCU71169.1 O-Antigen ligase [Pigmentiphaga humi]